MLIKFLLTIFILSNLSFADDDGAKFLVVDNPTYEKIEKLNLLNGGINKEYIVSSSRLTLEDLKQYYPEYFLYQGEICNAVNKVVKVSEKNKVKSTEPVLALKTKEEIQDEVRKIKLLQMLSEAKQDTINTSTINEKIIKGIGIVCDNKLVLKGKKYSANDTVGTAKIDSISIINGIIYIEGK